MGGFESFWNSQCREVKHTDEIFSIDGSMNPIILSLEGACQNTIFLIFSDDSAGGNSTRHASFFLSL